MKVVFIEPRASEANIYSRIPMPLLGPIYLATILKNRGHEVEIYKEDIAAADYAKLKADVIGISILTSTARRGYEIAKKFPREKVIIGGIHASLLPHEAAQFARQVIIGEAENSIVDVIEGKITDRLVYGQAPLDLDKLPFPDFSLLKGFRYSSARIPISTSRGCPYDCSFCSVTKIFGRKYRFRSTQSVIQELLSRKTNTLFFCDDNFAAHPKRTHSLLSFMLKNKIRDWACQVRCDITKDNSLVGLMAKAGCSVVCVGFESINSLSLKAYEKKQTIADIISAIRSFHRKKIKIHGMFVLGGDNDNRKTIFDTARFARRHKIDTLQMCVLTPFPGTKVYDELEREGRIFTKDWSLYDGQHIVFNPKLLSARELQVSVIKAYSKFYGLARSFSLVLGFHFRNALFNLMGCSIVKQWKRANHKMPWILEKEVDMVKKAVIVMVLFAFCIAAGSFVFAAEHGGTATQEHGGKAKVKAPAADDIRAAMKNYVDAKSQATGSFDVLDPETAKVRKLKLDRVHERVGKTGNYYYSCADFTDTESSEKLDLDLDVEDKDGVLNVVDVRIHKVNAKERYTYDEHDNRNPVPVAKEEKHEHGGHEHGGKEHGGK